MICRIFKKNCTWVCVQSGESVNCAVHTDPGGIFVPPGSLNQPKYSWSLHKFYLLFLSLPDEKGLGYKRCSSVIILPIACPSAYLAVSCSNHRENKIASRSPLGVSFAVFWIPLSSSAWHRCSKRSVAAPSFVAFCAPGGVVVIWPSSFVPYFHSLLSTVSIATLNQMMPFFGWEPCNSFPSQNQPKSITTDLPVGLAQNLSTKRMLSIVKGAWRVVMADQV